jgi:hypothetical protein
MVKETVEVMRGHEMILLPLDPTGMLALSKGRNLMLPAQYDADIPLARSLRH